MLHETALPLGLLRKDDDVVPLLFSLLDRGPEADRHLLLPVIPLLARTVEEKDRGVGLLGGVGFRDVDHILDRRAVMLDRLVEESGLPDGSGREAGRGERQDEQRLLHKSSPLEPVTIDKRRSFVPRFWRLS